MTHESNIPDFAALDLEPATVRDLRSDHAGEWGAVEIYRGIIATTRSDAVRRFASEHMQTEVQHRAFFDSWLPRRHHSRLLPVWRGAGWLLGAIAGISGEKAVYCTVAAVETFVERHYLAQVESLSSLPRARALRDQLAAFCADEVAHRNEACDHGGSARGLVGAAWFAMVGVGSAIGVSIARVV